MNNQGKGLRFNQGKARYDLIPPFAQEQYAQVLTKGAEKYAERNWEKGMPWSKILASLERHLYAIKRGEDYDPETGLLHSAHVMCNAAFMTEYYKIFPQGDDRPTFLTKKPRIGIDIDDVLADFLSAYCKNFNVPEPNAWMFDRNFQKRYEEILNNPDFYRNLNVITPPENLPTEPVAYITSREASTLDATIDWLAENNYPVAPVVFTKDKLSACKEHEIDIFIDDKYDTFENLNRNGVFCYLFDASHNQRYNVGFRRINKETIKKIL